MKEEGRSSEFYDREDGGWDVLQRWVEVEGSYTALEDWCPYHPRFVKFLK